MTCTEKKCYGSSHCRMRFQRRENGNDVKDIRKGFMEEKEPVGWTFLTGCNDEVKARVLSGW